MISKVPHNFTFTILVNVIISRGKMNSISKKEGASFSQLTLGRVPSLEPTGLGDTHAWGPQLSVINTRVLFWGTGLIKVRPSPPKFSFFQKCLGNIP